MKYRVKEKSRSMMYSYFLSENQASDISVATHAKDCPEELFTLLRAMYHISDRARPMLSHSLAGTNKEPAELKAYGILARAAAQVAREYWLSRPAGFSLSFKPRLAPASGESLHRAIGCART